MADMTKLIALDEKQEKSLSEKRFCVIIDKGEDVKFNKGKFAGKKASQMLDDTEGRNYLAWLALEDDTLKGQQREKDIIELMLLDWYD